MIIPGAVRFPPSRAAVLLAVVEQRHPTVRSVAQRAGVSLATAYEQLRRLRDLGLVAWEPGCAHTLRARVTVELVAGGGA